MPILFPESAHGCKYLSSAFYQYFNRLLGRPRDVQDWEFGFTQTQRMHRRELCWLHQHETKDVLANYGGQIIDSRTVGDVPFARQSDNKPAALLRTMVFQDSPFRRIPF